ncbi:hypothetical protein [uncultured Endozoicomonas sp.]|uniref:hypothetical protein n=1 Tax=uncultured Endozoicomonas sp. TaxID=432652 RepID=UPI0026368F92|nr:hypothetical protein [uncultured Endozoicomonas sp.]
MEFTFAKEPTITEEKVGKEQKELINSLFKDLVDSKEDDFYIHTIRSKIFNKELFTIGFEENDTSPSNKLLLTAIFEIEASPDKNEFYIKGVIFKAESNIISKILKTRIDKAILIQLAIVVLNTHTLHQYNYNLSFDRYAMVQYDSYSETIAYDLLMNYLRLN